MDKSWMYADRRSNGYKLGVDEFCEFALKNSRNNNNICCPCSKCKNEKDFSIKVIRDHLFFEWDT